MSRAVQLSAGSVEHYGPAYLGDMAREVFGGPIILDPASCYQANLLIKAVGWYGPDWIARGRPDLADGLARPWFGTVYLNPPGGRVRIQGQGHKVNSAALWYAALAHRFDQGLVSQALFMVFNLELLRYALEWPVKHPLEFPVCIPKDRIDFWKPGDKGEPVPQGSPGHPNMIIYMGPNVPRFREVFQAARQGTDWTGGRVFSPDGWWERYQT